jgi:hypothetical protein
MIARDWLERGRPAVERAFAPVGAAIETASAVRTRLQIARVRKRAAVHQRFPAPIAEPARVRVVAVVTHVADPARGREESAARLERTLDGLLESLGHTELELVLNTLPGRHVADALPEHLRSRLVVREHENVEPMFAGFEAQREFERRAEDADWFLYTEDDIVLCDPLVLEKLRFFNDGAPPEAVLLPHRYELWNGRKFFIDVWSRSARPEERPWNRLTLLEIGDWRFAEFENPHSGFYCLSREQVARWLATGRRWYGLASYVGPRESAATGCLEECFRLYKPRPDTMHFLEIRHLGTKYAELYASLHEAEAQS